MGLLRSAPSEAIDRPPKNCTSQLVQLLRTIAAHSDALRDSFPTSWADAQRSEMLTRARVRSLFSARRPTASCAHDCRHPRRFFPPRHIPQASESIHTQIQESSAWTLTPAISWSPWRHLGRPSRRCARAIVSCSTLNRINLPVTSERTARQCAISSGRAQKVIA